MSRITNTQKKAIRSYYGHGEGNCKVRIRANGEVHGTGSTDDYDRSRDGVSYYLCHVGDVLRAMHPEMALKIGLGRHNRAE